MTADVSTTAHPRTRRNPPDAATLAVFAGLVANAATAFSIQAWLSYSFARHVWGMPQPLCVALVVALDVFAVLFMVLTYQLRGAGRRRITATAVFLFAVGAQVYAAELYAAHMNWPGGVRVFAVLPALLLALAQEGVILWRTHRADPAQRNAEPPVGLARHGTLPPLQAQMQAPSKAVPAGHPRPRGGIGAVRAGPSLPPRRRDVDASVRRLPSAPAPDGSSIAADAAAVSRADGRAQRQRDPRWADVIKRCVDGGEDAKTVAADLGVKERTAQLWVKAEREARAARARLAGPRDAPARTVSDEQGPASASGAAAHSDAPVPKGGDPLAG
jgi:hypothetical protein